MASICSVGDKFRRSYDVPREMNVRRRGLCRQQGGPGGRRMPRGSCTSGRRVQDRGNACLQGKKGRPRSLLHLLFLLLLLVVRRFEPIISLLAGMIRAFAVFPERRRVAPPTTIAACYAGTTTVAVTTFWEPWWPNRISICEPSAVLGRDSDKEVWVRHTTWWRSRRSTANHFHHRCSVRYRGTFFTVVFHPPQVAPTDARHGFAAV